jgi:hypothetical protein
MFSSVTSTLLWLTLRRVTLNEHQTMIDRRISSALGAEEQRCRALFMSRFGAAGSAALLRGTAPDKAGMLDIRRKESKHYLKRTVKRRVQGHWKRRYVVVKDTSLFMYKVRDK